MKRIMLMLLIFTVSIFIGYSVGTKQANKVNEAYRVQIETEMLENNPIPVCNDGDCPYFQHFDVDGDGKRENIVTEYFGMTQFTGRVLVIDEGKVVFISKGKMRIRVDPVDEGNQENGFVISYSTVANSNKDVQRDYYKFVDGKYILEKSEINGQP